MAFQERIFDNDVDIRGGLSVGGIIELGFGTTTGTERTVQLLGSEANIGLNFIPKGTSTLRVPTGYEANLANGRDIVNKAYVDTKIAAKDLSSILITPTVTQDGYAIIWDNTNSEFTLGPAAGGGSSYTFGSGIENLAGTIKLGGPALDRNTDIIGPFDLNLGTLASKLSNVSINATTKVEAIGGTSRLTLNGANPIELTGGAVLSSIIFNAGGGIILTDAQAGANQRGLRGAASYATNIQANDYTQKVYVDSKLGGKNLSANVTNPTVTENGYSVVWDNSLNAYKLALITGGGSTGTTIKKEEQFVTTGIESVFTVTNGTILQFDFVDIGGAVQRNGVNYIHSGQSVDFGSPLPPGVVVTVHYFEDLSIGGGGGSGDGHTIQNNGASLTQRTNLNFRNGITASDISGDSVVELGGILTKNTSFTGAGFSFTGTGFSSFQFSAPDIAFTSNIGAGLTIENNAIHLLRLGQAAGVIFNLGSDADGDLYIRDNGRFSRLAIGSNGTVLTSNGTTAAWQASGSSVTNGSGTNVTGTSVNLGGTLTTDANILGNFNVVIGNSVTKVASLTADANTSISFVQGSRRIALTATGAILDLSGDSTGDIYYRNSTGFLSRLQLGNPNTILGVNNAGNAPEYKAISTSTTAVANNIGVTLTNPNSIVINIPDADLNVRGVVTTTSQIFNGIKRFTSDVVVGNAVSTGVIIGAATAGKMLFNGSSGFMEVGCGTTGGHFYINKVTQLLGIKLTSITTGVDTIGPAISLGTTTGTLSLESRGTSGNQDAATIKWVGLSTFSASTYSILNVRSDKPWDISTGTTGSFTAIRMSIPVQCTGGTSTLIGIDYNPTETNMVGVTHYGILQRSSTALSGFGVGGAPTALIHVAGSNTTRPSVKINSGTLVSVITGGVNDGALEYNGTHLYFTIGSTRFQLDQQGGGGGGGVTSIDVSGGSTGLSFSGGPVTGTGTITLAGSLNAVSGGTGQTVYVVGDLLQASTTTALSKLAAVATGNVLISGGVGTVSSWGKVGLSTHVSGILAGTNGGTAQSTTAIGDLLIGASSNSWAKLAAVATGNVLISGGVATNPSWGKVNLSSHVTGNLAIGNLDGGINATNTTFWRGDGVWATPAGGSASPGGANNEIQINDSGSFGGDKIFIPSSGNLVLGDTGLAGDRTILASGSDTSTEIHINGAGTAGHIRLNGSGTSAQSSNVYIGDAPSTTTARKLNVYQQTTGAQNTVGYLLKIQKTSTVTPTVGMGVGIEFETQTASTVKTGATIEAVTTNVTSSTEAYDLVFKTMTAGGAASERLRLSAGLVTVIGNIQLGNTGLAGNRTISVESSDTNANLLLSGKADGNVELQVNSTGIVYLGSNSATGSRNIHVGTSSGTGIINFHGKGASGALAFFPQGSATSANDYLSLSAGIMSFSSTGSAPSAELIAFFNTNHNVKLSAVASATEITLIGGYNGIAADRDFVLSAKAGAGSDGNHIAIIGGGAASGFNKGNIILRTLSTGTGTRGYLIIQDLPTSSAGLPTGAVWNDSGTLKIA